MKVVDTELAYEQVKLIGSGNFGTVYLADDPQLGGRIAIKEIPKSIFADVSEFFKEAHAMFASEHPNVVRILYASTATDHVCLAMAYYPNGSLDDLIAKGPLAVARAMELSQDMLSGLEQIHLARLVHFDVKPSNILLDNLWRALVADFGQARAIAANGLAAVPLLYNATRPPEAITTLHGSVATDVYQAGLTLYRAVNGNPWWQEQLNACGSGLISAIQKGTFPNRSSFFPHVPKRLRTVIRKAINVDPSQRFASATAFADALSSVAIKFNWQVEISLPDNIRWTGAAKSGCTVVVELQNESSGWAVRTYTDSKGKLRAKDPADGWKSKLTKAAALKHLDWVFSQLELGQRIRRTVATP